MFSRPRTATHRQNEVIDKIPIDNYKFDYNSRFQDIVQIVLCTEVYKSLFIQYE